LGKNIIELSGLTEEDKGDEDLLCRISNILQKSRDIDNLDALLEILVQSLNKGAMLSFLSSYIYIYTYKKI
jgi:hypothetical protein